MTATAKRLFTPQQLTASLATYYTVPSNTNTILKKVTFCNNSGSARTITVHLVPSGGTADDTNIIIDEKSVADQETFEATVIEGHAMNAGDFIQAKASAATDINIMASGVEITN